MTQAHESAMSATQWRVERAATGIELLAVIIGARIAVDGGWDV